MKPIFQRSPTLTLRLLFFSALSVSLMTLEQHNDDIHLLRTQLNHLVYPLQYLVNLPTRGANWAGEAFSSHSRLIAENRKLKNNQLILQSQLQKLELLEAENERLQNLLSSAKRVKQRVLIAEMLAVDMDPYRQNILIDKGSNHDVYVGQPIIDAHGIMGQIIRVSSNSSTALLISDPSHSIPVRVVRNGLRSIATGIGQADQIKLNFIPGNGDIEVGDVLVSSGLGGRFPVDFPVATVSRVRRPAGKPFATVFAQPAAELDRSHEILLVWQDDAPAVPDSSEPAPAQSQQQPWPSIDSLALQLVQSLPDVR
ncbi:MAG: rod shape-determining protein MreC [Gammaproteobacteria bacterium]|nr:rod shape-determining protein MreC [Gammaproteobacteria bacterium]